MSKDRDLRLNSLERYAKRSPGLVLEEHSHCEVPAGCGGVVLRWFNPAQALPLTVHAWTPSGECALFLDGAPLASARPLVAHGSHVVALELRAPVPAQASLLFAACYVANLEAKLPDVAVPRFALVSSADGEWRGTTRAPEDDRWRTLYYDDSAWTPLVARATSAPDRRTEGAWRHQELVKLGAQPIGLPGHPTGTVWVRRRFDLLLLDAAPEPAR